MFYVPAIKPVCVWVAILLLGPLTSVAPSDTGWLQTVDLPASGAVASASVNGLWLYGGHSVAKFDFGEDTVRGGDSTFLYPSRPYDRPLEKTAASPSQRLDLADSLMAAVAEVSQVASHMLLIAGTQDHELGWLGRYDFSVGAFAWRHSDLNRPITSLAMFGERVIVGNDAGELAAFEATSGQVLWEQAPHAKLVTAVVRMTDTLGASGDWTGKIVLWDPATGNSLGDFQQHRDRIVSLTLLNPAASPGITTQGQSSEVVDTPWMVSASRDGTVRLWYPKQRRLVRFVQLDQPLTALAALSATQVVVATNDARLHHIDLEQAKVLATYDCQIDFVTQLVALEPTRVLALQGTGAVERIELRQ